MSRANARTQHTHTHQHTLRRAAVQLRASAEARTYDIVSNASYVGEEDQGHRGGRRHLYDSSRNYNIIAPSGDDPSPSVSASVMLPPPLFTPVCVCVCVAVGARVDLCRVG